MKKLLSLILAIFLLNIPAVQAASAKKCLLEQGMMVKLELAENVSSTLNNEGDTVNFIVSDNVNDGDTILIKAGSRATGIVSKLIPKGRLGKEGQIILTINYAEAVDGQRVSLFGTIERYGENRAYFTAGSDFMIGSLVANVISLLSMPVLLFVRGTDATLPAGYPYHARVEKDVNVSIENL